MSWFNLRSAAPLKNFRREMEGRRLVRRFQRGLLTVPVDHIVGSIGKAESMNRRFRYKNGAVDRRLSQLRAANQWGMVALPPIELYELDGEYYVVDGHHRVAVALENRQVEIDAYVTAHQVEDLGEPLPICA